MNNNLSYAQKLESKKVRCITCGFNVKSGMKLTENHCNAHCSGCSQPVGTHDNNWASCKCCSKCNSLPCVCHRNLCDDCGYMTIQCQCCANCDTYPCICENEDEDCDCPSCTSNGNSCGCGDSDCSQCQSGYGRGSMGKTETAPWTKIDGITVDGRTHNNNYNGVWKIDLSIDVARAAADFYLLEAIRYNSPNPVKVKPLTVAATPVANGIGAWGGFTSGLAAFSSVSAAIMERDGQPVILVMPMTTPEDILGMKAARGILTTTGGTSSHAAVVARGWNKTCVVGASMTIGKDFQEGDLITIDGKSGRIFVGSVSPENAKANKLSPFAAPARTTENEWDYNDDSNILNCAVPTFRHGNSLNWNDDEREGALSWLKTAGIVEESVESVMAEAALYHEICIGWYAENFRKAAHCAIGGELRHHKCIGGTVLKANDRAAAWTGWKEVIEQVGSERALAYGQQLFMEMGGSYGGQRWHDAAETLAMYEKGDLSDALWIDRVMALTHNGGMILDKIPWNIANSKGYGVSSMQSIVLPAHGESNWKMLLKIASPVTVELFTRYWAASNSARICNGERPIPEPGSTIVNRIACSSCWSKPWIGHHGGCSHTAYGKVKAAPYKLDAAGNPPKWCAVVDDEEWSFRGNWWQWTDGPYLYDQFGKMQLSQASPIVVIVHVNSYSNTKKIQVELPLGQWETHGIVLDKTGLKPYDGYESYCSWTAKVYASGKLLSIKESGYTYWEDVIKHVVKPYEMLKESAPIEIKPAEFTPSPLAKVGMTKFVKSLIPVEPKLEGKSAPTIEVTYEKPTYSAKGKTVTVATESKTTPEKTAPETTAIYSISEALMANKSLKIEDLFIMLSPSPDM